MEIKTATDFEPIYDTLKRDLAIIGFNHDLVHMLTNIKSMVADLSKKEVECRRMHNFKPVQESVERINKAINHLDQLLLMAKLMQ